MTSDGGGAEDAKLGATAAAKEEGPEEDPAASKAWAAHKSDDGQVVNLSESTFAF